MSCNHIDITAESNQYHEGQLVCICCGIVVAPGQLVSNSFSPPTRWLVPRIIEDVLGLVVPESGRCQIRTTWILADFDAWWVMFLDSKKKNT
jgi:hypothetical protein